MVQRKWPISGGVDSSLPVANVRDFGAVGNNIANDTAAFDAAVDSLGSVGGTVYVPAGTYKLSSVVTTKSKIQVVGAGRDTTKLVAAAGAFTWPSSGSLVNARFADLYIRNDSGHMFTSTSGLVLVSWERCWLWSNTTSGSILEQSTADNYIRVTVDDCNLLRPGGSTVPAWNVVNSIGGANCNVWRNLIVDNDSSVPCTAPFFHLESTASGNYCYDNRFEDLCGERNTGGIIRALSVRNLFVDNVTDYDATANYTADMVKVGKSVTGGSLPSANVIVTGCGRRGGTLDPGVYDVNLVPGEVSRGIIVHPQNSASSGKINFGVNDLVDVVNAAPSAWTGQPGNAVTSFGSQVQFRTGLYLGTTSETAGTGSPEGAVTGSPGDRFIRTDGARVLYVKESGTGNTGWVTYARPAVMTYNRRLLSGFPQAMQVGTVSWAKDVWRFMPLTLDADTAVGHLGTVWSTGATGGTANMIFALYGRDSFGTPSDLVADYSTYGSLDLTTGVGGEQLLETTGLTIPAGDWFLACAWTGTASSPPTIYATTGVHPSINAASITQQASAFTKSISGATPPDPAGTDTHAQGIAVYAVL